MTQELVEAAIAVRKNAYAPYSNYLVGVALIDENGQIHLGANVENASYPVGMCAERAAIAAMVAAGGRRIMALALVTRDGGMPCGMCRQAISEFASPELVVTIVDEAGHQEKLDFASLFPRGFKIAE